jgi:hypothetical protein
MRVTKKTARNAPFSLYHAEQRVSEVKHPVFQIRANPLHLCYLCAIFSVRCNTQSAKHLGKSLFLLKFNVW